MAALSRPVRMRFDPFAPGPFPVGSQSGLIVDGDRNDRRLPYAVWYPEGGARQLPLVLYSHASGGRARQSSFLCAHLASHGYAVAAVDHTGNTAADFAERAKRIAAGDVLSAEESDRRLRQIIADRVPDLRFLLDQIQSRSIAALADRSDKERVGIAGWSFGGWAALATLERDDRFRAVLALAPAGNSRPLPGIIPATLTFEWKRDVPALYLVAERDRFTPLPGEYELYERTPSRRRMFILGGADHQHFADEIDDPGSCSPEHAHLFTRGLGLAHFDAVLGADAAAERFLEDDALARSHELGIAARKYAGPDEVTRPQL